MSVDRMEQLSWIYDLYSIGQEGVLQKKETSEVYQQILTYVVNGFNAQSGSLALCDKEDDGFVTIIAGFDLPPGTIGSKVKMGDGILGQVAQEGKALLVSSDSSNSQRFQICRENHRATATHSVICWPMETEGRIIGAISIDRPDGLSSFTEAEMEWGSILLNMVGLILSNMQLHIDQKHRLEELQFVNQKLEEAQNHLMQSEKMASIGQLAAGVAHEINNPIGYVYSNLGTLEKYVQDTFGML
ncbi:MAG: GAF domain-containing protein, partial [Nitrosomonadales bacterium]|nr:GAF domain-containing protein [Nitrosomonadales bacterium]